MTGNGKRGFTLAELIVTAAITVIVIGAAATIMITGLDIFNKSTETAIEQREITLAETALKENMVTATSLDGTYKTGAADVNLYFDGSDFVMQIGATKITASSITGVSMNFVTTTANAKNVYSVRYTIKTKGVEHSGEIVMNNVKTLPFTSCDLTPNHSNVLHMVISK